MTGYLAAAMPAPSHLLPLLLLPLLAPFSAPAAASDPTDPASQLTVQYAENGTWTEDGLVRLVSAIQRSASGLPPAVCHGQNCDDTQQCLTPEELLTARSGEPASVETFCPALLHQTQAAGCIDRLTQHTPKPSRSRPGPFEVWGYGLLFVTVISLSSIFAVLLLPMLGRACFDRLMPALIGLAVGSLASSALFHLIPQAFEMVVEGGGHGYLNTSLCVLAGAWFFFMLERLMKIALDYKKRQVGSDKDGQLSVRLDADKSPPATVEDGSTSSDSAAAGASTICALPLPADGEAVRRSLEEPVRAMFGHVDEKPRSHHHHDHQVQFKRGDGSLSSIAVVAWMVIFGDGFHNFLDGLGIGAAFSENTLTGISISLAVLCEELPHELGDFAVLLDAGMTVRQAVVYNFLSACTCYLGLVVGVLIGDFTESTSFVFALAAGMFLYISLVDMVPEMNEAAEKASGISVTQGLRMLLIQNVGMMTGCFSLFALAYYQDSLALN